MIGGWRLEFAIRIVSCRIVSCTTSILEFAWRRNMTNYAKELMALDDQQLVVTLESPMPGSARNEQIQFEMQRRAMIAQQAAAAATLRSAMAAERYTHGLGFSFW
jgi:hypothetical protein